MPTSSWTTCSTSCARPVDSHQQGASEPLFAGVKEPGCLGGPRYSCAAKRLSGTRRRYRSGASSRSVRGPFWGHGAVSKSSAGLAGGRIQEFQNLKQVHQAVGTKRLRSAGHSQQRQGEPSDASRCETKPLQDRQWACQMGSATTLGKKGVDVRDRVPAGWMVAPPTMSMISLISYTEPAAPETSGQIDFANSCAALRVYHARDLFGRQSPQAVAAAKASHRRAPSTKSALRA